MAAHIAESRIARAMQDDEMMAVHCDDRPDLYDDFIRADGRTRLGTPISDPDDEGIDALGWRGVLAMGLVVALIGFWLAIGGS